MRDATSVAALLLIVVDGVLLAAAALARARTTDRRLLHRSYPIRVFRDVRSAALRIGLWFPSWPHVLNRLLPGPPRAHLATPASLVWAAGTATVTRSDPPPTGPAEPVLVVHSLITRPWILDLMPGRSLVAGLRDAGLDTHLLDWGDPAPAAVPGVGWDESAELLGAAIRELAHRSPTGRVHVVGYCMGATLALATTAAYGAGPVASLSLIAPPVDTQVPGGMGDILRSPTLTPVLALDGTGRVPPWVLREAFHVLRRKTVLLTLARLRRRSDREFQQITGALDRWAWEQRPLAGRLAFDIVDLYRGNTMVGGELTVGGAPVDLAAVDLPVLVAVTDRDHIVPIASSLALTRLLPAEPAVVRCPGGHVSMLMGTESRTTLLPALTDFLRKHGAAGKSR